MKIWRYHLVESPPEAVWEQFVAQVLGLVQGFELAGGEATLPIDLAVRTTAFSREGGLTLRLVVRRRTAPPEPAPFL